MVKFKVLRGFLAANRAARTRPSPLWDSRRTSSTTSRCLEQQPEIVASRVERARFAAAALIDALGASEHAHLASTPITLEPELLLAGNATAVWAAWSAQQPIAWATAKTAIEALPADDRAVAFARRSRPPTCSRASAFQAARRQ